MRRTMNEDRPADPAVGENVSDRTPSGPRGVSRRRFVQSGATLSAALAAGGLLAACGDDSDSSAQGGDGSGPDEDVSFGFSHPFAEVPIVASVKKLVKMYGEDEGWEVLL